MNKTRPTIAITGANGFLGSNLVTHFSGLGWQVVALVRHPENFKNSNGITYKLYELGKPIRDDTLKNVDYLVHTAYVAFSSQTRDIMKLNVSGTKRLLAVSRQQNVKKNIFISSMSAHEEAESAYGQQKLAIEKLFKNKNDLSLRPGLIIGDGGIVKKMVSFMKTKHLVPLIGGGKQPLQFISVGNLAQAIENSIKYNLSGIMTVANPKVYSYKQFYKSIAEILNIKVLFIPVPFWSLMSFFKLVKLTHIPLSINEDNLLGLKKLRSVDTRANLNRLKLKPDNLKNALKANGV